MKERGVDLSGHISPWIGDLDLDLYRWIVYVGHDEAEKVRSALLALLDQVIPHFAQHISGASFAGTNGP